MATFIERDDEKFMIQLNTFANKLPQYMFTLGFTQTDVDAANADREISQKV